MAIDEVEKRELCWPLAEKLFSRWHSAHGLTGQGEAWRALDDWAKGYWYSVAEFVLDNFEVKYGH